MSLEDEELNALTAEIDSGMAEIDAQARSVDELFSTLETIYSLEGALRQFISNMNSLSCVFDLIPEGHHTNSFLIGTLWSGVLSAYEGFTHEIFDIALRRSDYAEMAIQRLSALSKEDKDKFRLGKVQSAHDLRKLLRKATLNNPNNGVQLANHLLELEIPKIDEGEMVSALIIRNSYAHNNGGESVSLSELKLFHGKIDDIVSHYANGFLAKSNTKKIAYGA